MSTSSSLDYDQFGDLELAHFDALKAAGILHRDISLMNLILALRYGPRSNHSRFMDKLHTEKRDALCRKIDSLGRRGVLVDWGYAVPVPSLSDPVAAEDSEHQLTARNIEHVVSRPSPVMGMRDSPRQISNSNNTARRGPQSSEQKAGKQTWGSFGSVG